MNNYFLELNKENDINIITSIKDYALMHDVPIISDEGLQYLMQLIRLTKAKRILEIGSAIGFSSINMASIESDIQIITIEKNEEMKNLALENISRAKFNKQIQVVFGDALEVELDNQEFDLIFIDAAKAQYQNLFCKYEKYLKTSGIIVCDNLLFHGLVNSKTPIESRNLRALVRKIDAFNKWLSQNNKYRTVFLNIGDGMAVSEKL